MADLTIGGVYFNEDLDAQFGGNISLGDAKELIFGAATDFKIYHNNTTNVNHVSSLLDRQLSINGNIINLTNQANDSTYLLLNSTGGTFVGDVTLNTKLIFDYGGDHYLQSGTDSLAYKTSGGTSVMSLNASTYAATFSGQVNVGTKLLMNNNQELRWEDSGSTERTILELTSADDLYVGGSFAGSMIFVGGGSYTERLRINDSGNTEFTSDAVVSADSTYDLGTSAKRWANLYVDTITITNDLPGGPYLPLSAGSSKALTGSLYLGVADSSSGHVNAYENMTFNIDIDNDDTSRYFAWYTDAADGGGTELLKILETGVTTFAGNVGIGLTTSYPLQVSGIIASKESTGTLRLEGTAATASIFDLKADSDVFKIRDVNAGNEMYHIRKGASGYHKFYINDSLAFDIDSSSNSTFTGDITVTGGDITIGTDSVAGNINSVGDVMAFDVDSNTGGGTASIQWKMANSEKMRLTTSGLGIGTDSPNEALHVIGTDGVAKFYYESSYTASTYPVVQIGMMTSGTAAAGFGPELLFRQGGNGYDGYAQGSIRTARGGTDNTSTLYISAYGSGSKENGLTIVGDGATSLGYNNSDKLATMNTGISVTGVVHSNDGDKDAPAYSFTNDTNTGMWRSTTDTLNFACGGTHYLQIAAAGITAKTDIVLDAADIQLDTAVSAATSSGTIIKFGSTVSMSAGQVVYGSNSMGSLIWAGTDADTGTKNILGLALGTSPTSDGILLNGIYHSASHGFTVGLPLYISTTGGEMTTTAPSGSGDYVRVVGYAIDANHIYFCPDNTWVEIS